MSELQSEPVASPSAVPSASAHGADSDSIALETLSHLAKMSGTGSAFGAAEYVAISPMAIATLVLGFASALSLLAPIFLFIPLLGLICGAIAIRQIRGSNGTQGGFGLAVGGLALSLLLGGGILLKETIRWSQNASETKAVSNLISHFGDEAMAGHFDAIYDTMMTDNFRSEVDRNTFRAGMHALTHAPAGSIDSMSWNQEPMDFEPIADGVGTVGRAMAMIRFHHMPDAWRETVRADNRDGVWRIDALPQLFPEKRNDKPRAGQ